MSNFFKFLFVGATAVTLVIPGSLLEAARAKKQTPQNSDVKAVPSRRANVPMRQIKRLLASPQPDNENWNTQVKQSIALLKTSKPAQADAFEQRYLVITTKGKAPVTIAPEVIVEAEVERVEIKEETVPEFQQQVQKIAQAANLTGDDLTKFQAFADTMQNIKNIEQEFKGLVNK